METNSVFAIKWFGNIKIRNKLFIVFGLLACIMISFAVFSTAQVIGIGNNLNALINSYQARQIHVADAIADAYSMRVANLSRGYLLEDDNLQNVVSRLLENYEKNAELFMEHLNSFREITLADARANESEKQQNLAIANGIIYSFTKYTEIIEKLDAALESKNKQQVLQVFEEVIPTANTLHDQLQNLRDLLFFTTKHKASETTEATAHTLNVIFAITVGFVFLSAFALLFTVSNINQPISKLEKAVAAIAQGKLTYPIRSDRKDELGSLANHIGNMVDEISEYNKVAAIMDNLDSMVCVADFDYNLLFINKRLADTFSLDRENCIGQKCYAATRNKERPCAFCQLPELLPMQDSFPSKDYEYMWDDVLNAWIGGTDSIIRWVDGATVFFRSVRDVSQKKQQEASLQEALQAAKTASVAKSSFLANMSHEIRTPMNAILGITEIQLQSETLAPNIREAFGRIYNSGDLLLGIINDILDMSKIEAGKLELTPAEYDIASLINDVAQLNMMRVGSKPIEFRLQVDENTPSTAVGDALRVKQILHNVLSNAFKYTEQGVITLSVFAETADKESETTLVFLVSDTGQGMTEEQLSRLFDEYSRFNMRTNRTIEGTGLGMSITRNLVRMMHGEILVQSEPGRGSTFTVRLPQGNAGAGVLGRELVESLRQFRITSTTQMKRTQITREPMPYGSILVVDDVEANIYVARGLLAPYGLTIDSAESGFAAIEKIEQGAAYDIVFMDHMMPEMDGIEATKIMRDLGYTNPIIALTANAVTGQAEIFREKGFDDFIAKPIDIRQMNILLNKFVRDRHPPEVVEAARLQKSDSHEYAGDIMPPLAADPKLAKIFIRDASKSIAVLETLPKEHGAYSDENVQTYVISVHGMKSALANIGESELSALAYKLEQAGREKNIAVMVSETPIFLKALQEVIKKITPREDDEVKEATEENSAYLREKLLVLKAACAAYDKKAAKDTLAEIGQKAWPRPTRALLETIAEHLLHSKFKEIVSTVDTSDCL